LRKNEYLPDKIHEGVGSGDVPGGARPGDGLGVAPARVDGDDEDDAEHHRAHRGRHVVGDGAAADSTRQTQIERADGRDQRGHDQRQDQRLEHPQEQVADVAHVHHLPGSPFFFSAQTHSKKHKREISFKMFLIWDTGNI